MRPRRCRGVPALGDFGRARELCFETRCLLAVGVDLSVDLLTVGVVVGERGMDAGQGQVFVLPDDRLG